MMMIKETQFNENVGRVLIRLRHANNLTQTKVAKRLNKTFQQVQKYEKGKNATSSFRLLELATIYKTTVQNIITEALELSNIQISTPEEIKVTELTEKDWIKNPEISLTIKDGKLELTGNPNDQENKK